MMRPLSLLAMAGVLAGCAAAVLSSLPANPPAAYVAQIDPAVGKVRSQFTSKGEVVGKPANVLIAPLYLSAKYQDSNDIKGDALAEYIGWWGAKPDSGGWAMQRIANNGYKAFAAALQDKNYTLKSAQDIASDATMAQQGGKPPANDFFINVGNVGPGEGPYAYMSEKLPYYRPAQAAALATALKVDTVVFPRVQVYFDKRKAGLSKMNEEIVIDYDMLIAADTVVCDRAGRCKTVTLSGREPATIRVPVPNLKELKDKANRNANSLFSEKLAGDAVAKLLVAQFEAAVPR